MSSAAAAERAPMVEARSTFRRDVVVLLVLVLVHEGCRHVLADGVVVSSLLAPSGIEAVAKITLGVFFLALRVALIAGAPGWIVAELLVAISRRCLCRG